MALFMFILGLAKCLISLLFSQVSQSVKVSCYYWYASLAHADECMCVRVNFGMCVRQCVNGLDRENEERMRQSKTGGLRVQT